MNIYLKALGCRLNEAEVSTWANEYIQQGYSITENENKADLIVFNSCSVTQKADKKSRQLIKRYHRNNPNAKIIATGCSSTLNHQYIREIDGVSLVVDNQQKDALVELSNNLINTPIRTKNKIADHQLFSRNRQRAFIKVQDGCRYRCTFCIVTVARGKEKSKPITNIISEILNLQKQGIKEIVLTGVHLGGYGSDNQNSLVEMIMAILKQTTIERIRLGSLEPWELSQDFFNLFENERLLPHLHLPLQSGTNTILQKMARRCKTDEFYKLITTARNSHPDMNITTDIIVGFPGETEPLWQDSFEFIQKCNFSHIHIFSYSKREGTKAARLPNQIENNIKKQRNLQLNMATEKTRIRYLEKQIGKKLSILWESKTEDLGNLTRQWGYTNNYLRVFRELPPANVIENQITKNTIKRIDKDTQCLVI